MRFAAGRGALMWPMVQREVASSGTGHSKRGTSRSTVTNSGTISHPCRAFVSYKAPPCRLPCSEPGRPLASRRCRLRPPRPATLAVPAEQNGAPPTAFADLQAFRRCSSSGW